MNTELDNQTEIEVTVTEKPEPKIKTLANCNPIEFLKQTNKIRKEIKQYLDLTQILEIRKRQPKTTSDEDTKAQIEQNLNDMLDKMLDEYPEQTAKVLGLMCFIDTEEELMSFKGVDLLAPALELISSEAVISFLVSWAK